MIVREYVPLSSLTTLCVGGPARFVIAAASDEEVRAACAFARTRSAPLCVLGDGSNVLAKDEGYEGVIIMPRLIDMSFGSEEAVVGAGVSWEAFVKEAASRNLWGVENLAGIPGTVGAAPVQNIGAYGAEVKDVISFVDVMRAHDGETERLTRSDCAFSYRDSIFKREEGRIILRVGFRLSGSGAPRLSYPDLMRARESGAPLMTAQQVGDAVRAIRAEKFPDLSSCGTAGSFFKNPVVSERAFDALKKEYPDIPGFEDGDTVKVPLAYILDKILGLRGYRKGSAHLYERQPLVLVLDRGGSVRDVEALARDVEARVFEATGIIVEREVRTL